MPTYTAHIPFIDDMGSISPINGLSDKGMESKQEELLWHLNKMREHDGLRPLRKLPPGVRWTIETA